MANKELTRDELLMLLKIVQVFEASYLVDDPAAIIGQMQQRFERSLQEHRAQLAPNQATRERLYRLGVRIRQAIGEQLNNDGSPTTYRSPAHGPGVHVAVADSLSEDDFDGIQRLLPQLSSTATYDRGRIELMLQHDGTDLVVARYNGVLVGMATLASFALPTGVRGHLDDVVVDETQRGRGIARALLEAVIELARTRGLRTLDLTSRPSRESAIRLYEAVGFERRDSLLMRYAGDLG
ncbi:GNAT family N-acetyltransferase [Leifsonia sp. C5G2]|uniref:GNAT family N-acetyltransferase n=1 Tax=Leifsonia sp. C5G2 TaxID=2735269 RepID=UPI00201BF5A3|nr:GNAT family N-acetyltransferase [Leifsonia sp. C5G2]